MDLPDSGLPKPKTPEQIQRELEKLREENPPDFAMQSARLIYELEHSPRKRRFAET